MLFCSSRFELRENKHNDIESRMNIKRRDLNAFVMIESKRLRKNINFKLFVDD